MMRAPAPAPGRIKPLEQKRKQSQLLHAPIPGSRRMKTVEEKIKQKLLHLLFLDSRSWNKKNKKVKSIPAQRKNKRIHETIQSSVSSPLCIKRKIEIKLQFKYLWLKPTTFKCFYRFRPGIHLQRDKSKGHNLRLAIEQFRLGKKGRKKP